MASFVPDSALMTSFLAESLIKDFLKNVQKAPLLQGV